jgi:PiT family inorganic phosphate transporter
VIEGTTVFILALLLAWANGANDIPKGIATLVGSGASRPLRAIAWGTLCTVAGGLAALTWGDEMVNTFSALFTAADPAAGRSIVAASLCGAIAWVVLATRTGLPVSTTHALLGGIAGAVLAGTGASDLNGVMLANRVLVPLLLSPLIAVAACWVLLLLARYVAARVPAWKPGCCEHDAWRKNPYVCAGGTQTSGRELNERLWSALHWFSGGATSFARGLNDVPKIAVFLIIADTLLPVGTGFSGATAIPIVAVTLTMALGGVWGSLKVLHVLAHRVCRLEPSSGLVANVGTSFLVLAATPLGFPVSTTHISTGALLGVRWAGHLQPHEADALKWILLGWVVTLPIAAAISASVMQVFKTL